MSNRERWVVYPLLFMSLGFSLTNGIAQQEKSALRDGGAEWDVVHCKTLEILGPDGKPRWVLGTTATGEGSFELVAKDGTLEAQLQSNPSGGLLSLYHRQDHVGLHLGFQNEEAQLVITDGKGRSIHSWISIPILPAGAVEPISSKSATDAGSSDKKSKSDETPAELPKHEGGDDN
jgi:hypothetical protein